MAQTDPITSAQCPGDDGRSGMPRWARTSLLAFLVVLLAGAAMLLAVRGEALLLDISKLSGQFFCL